MVPFLLLMAAASAQAAQGTHKVEIDGARYRVTVRGDLVEVARKSVFVMMSLDERDRMRRAVHSATSCSIRDEMLAANVLSGRLDC